jgi:general secretion pathway protein D
MRVLGPALVGRSRISVGLPRGRRMGRRVAWSFCFVLAGAILAACSIGGFDPRPDPHDNHPPDVMDHVRSLDLLPRFPKNGDSAATPNTANASRPAVFAGPGEVTVAQPMTRDEPPNGDGYDLNFENAPVATVAKVILGDILGVGYTIDPRVQGTVTLASGRPVAKSDILFVLENALRLSNVALVHDVLGYRLMPVGEAIGTGQVDVRR